MAIRVIRFLFVVLLAAAAASLIGRVFFDFDLPPDEDPHDLLRGLGVWAVAVLVGVFAELRFGRRRKRKSNSNH